MYRGQSPSDSVRHKDSRKGRQGPYRWKGGENYIDIMGVKLEYSDKKAAKAALRSYRN